MIIPVKSEDFDIQQIKEKLPMMMDATNMGTEFRFTVPPGMIKSNNDTSVNLYIVSRFATSIFVEIPGKEFYWTTKVAADQVLEFKIGDKTAYPWLKYSDEEPPSEEVFSEYGIHIVSYDPVLVYCVPQNSSGDGFLVSPVASLGKEYIVSSYGSMEGLYPGLFMPSESGVAAVYDSTTVEFTLGGNEKTETSSGQKPGEKKTYHLNKGDVVMITTKGHEADLTGSRWSADKLIAVVSGNYCANVPVDTNYCDYIAEMEAPVHTWGNNYLVAKIPGKVYPSIVRVFAKYAGTKIFRDGSEVGTIKEAGGIQGEGFLEMRIGPIDEIPALAVISGDKPINVMLYNTGTMEEENAGIGDIKIAPFEMQQIPIKQFLNNITILTPGISGKSGFPENYINLVYETNKDGMMPGDMKLGSVSETGITWDNLRTKFPGSDEPFKTDIDGKHYAVKTIKLPPGSVYLIKADNEFAAYSFGYSDSTSYGFPSAAAQRDLEHNDKEAPNVTFTMDSLGNVNDGYTIDMPDDPVNRSNLRSATMYNAVSYNYILTCDEIIPGTTKDVNWKLKVCDTDQSSLAIITFIDRGGNDTTIVVRYDPGNVSVEQGISNFNDLSLEAYPNPADDKILVEIVSKTSSNLSLNLYSIDGKIMISKEIENAGSDRNVIKIDSEKIPSGVYILCVSANGSIITKKVIISH